MLRSVVWKCRKRFALMLGKVREYAVGETLLDFAVHHDPLLGGTVTSNRLDYVPKQSSTKTTRAPEHPPMPARRFTAETVYSNTYTKKVRLPLNMLLLDFTVRLGLKRFAAVKLCATQSMLVSYCTKGHHRQAHCSEASNTECGLLSSVCL